MVILIQMDVLNDFYKTLLNNILLKKIIEWIMFNERVNFFL